MSFISVTFSIFFVFVLIIYYIVPIKYRYIVLFISSYIFYGWAEHNVVLILLLTTTITYIGGRIISKHPNKNIYWLFFFLNILVLVIFKYTNFTINNLNILLSKINPLWDSIPQLSIVLPIGLSFYVFQSSTYLSDIYRKKITIEKNFIRYAAFVSFFPTILSGPISKSRNLLPQIKQPQSLTFESVRKGFVLFVWGIFEKIAVANTLAIIVSNTFNDIYSIAPNLRTAYFIVGSISFSLYIYADFSSYSDMARGMAKLLGISIEKNFNNPYLSTTTSEFWNRWHMSLNEWFIENIYIPLGGNRKGKLRKYINILIVFLISGFWHGASWNFVIWGLLNGILVIIGQMIKPLKSSIYSKIGINEKCEIVLFVKRMVVFWLIAYAGEIEPPNPEVRSHLFR